MGRIEPRSRPKAFDPLEGLSDSQRRAVAHAGGHLLLLAGPGSGKTKVLTHKIAYLLLFRGISPQDILVITFTKAAARSMEERFCSLGLENAQSVRFATFHALFYSLLKQNRRQLRLCGREESLRLLKGLLEHMSSTRPAQADVEAVMEALSFYKNTLDGQRSRQMLPEGMEIGLEAILEAWRRLARERNVLDFDDMAYDCLDYIQSRPEVFGKRFPYILVDEFQDINPVQYRILRLLGLGGEVFAVGDGDQSIYGFRGSDPSWMRTFLEEFDAQSLWLEENYRSSRQIVDISQRLMRGVEGRSAIPIRAAGPERDRTGCIHFHGCAGREAQTEEVMALCEELARGGDSCGFIFRTHGDMQRWAQGLRRRGIPFVSRERIRSIYQEELALDVWAYLRLAYGQGDREDWCRISSRPPRGLSREDIWLAGRGGGGSAAWRQLQRDVARMGSMRPYMALQYLWRGLGYGAWARQRAGSGSAREALEERWESLLDLSKPHGDFARWDEERLAAERAMEDQPRADEAGKGLCLLTAHASKGLEFDHVLLADVQEGIFPHGEEGQEAEERRLFYVALTRAKKALDIFWVEGGRRRPSRYLEAIGGRKN